MIELYMLSEKKKIIKSPGRTWAEMVPGYVVARDWSETSVSSGR
jgi:hypothetical protein